MAHKQKQFFTVTARVAGGLSRPVSHRSNVYVLCAEPKEHKHFRPGTRPGGHRVLQGAARGGAILLHFCGSLDPFFSCSEMIHAQYDWTTGVPDNGNDWRKFRAVPRSFPCFVLRLIGVETEGLSDYQGRAGDHFHCTEESYSVSK